MYNPINRRIEDIRCLSLAKLREINIDGRVNQIIRKSETLPAMIRHLLESEVIQTKTETQVNNEIANYICYITMKADNALERE